MPDQHGPDSEQLAIKEDAERLAEIAELIRSEAADVHDFELQGWELMFISGYLYGASHDEFERRSAS